MEKEIRIKIDYSEDIPDVKQRFLAYIDEGEYAGIAVVGENISDCFKELGISINVLDDYRNNK